MGFDLTLQYAHAHPFVHCQNEHACRISCQAEHIMRGAYILQQENQHFRGFFIKFICCTDIPCSKDYATSCVGAWESKSLPSPGNELHISLTDHAARGWDLGWEDRLMVMLSYTFKLA